MNRISVLVSLGLGVILLSGCGSDPITQVRDTTSPVLYKRIVSLSPSSTEIATRLGYVEIVGRTASCDLPPQANVPVIMNGLKPDYEKIMALKADAVLYDHDIISESDLAKFKEMDLPTFDTGGGENTVASFNQKLLELGVVTHGESALSDYVDRINKEISTAKGNAISPAPKVAILLAGEGAEHMIAGTNSFTADLVRNAQAEPVGPAAKNFVTLNAEWFKSSDPDVIFVPGDPSSVQNDPRFKTLKAVLNKRVAQFSPELLMRRGGRVESAIKNLNVAIYNLMAKK